MSEYHNIAINSYQTVQQAIADASAHNIWNREFNFMSRTDTNEFYYDWIRVIKLLRTFTNYLMRENFKGDRTDLPYSINTNSSIPFERYAFEGIRIRVERLGNKFTFSSNHRISFPNGNKYPLEGSKQQQIGLNELYNASIMAFWGYYNSRIDMLGIKGLLFKNKCAYIAQGI